MSKDGKNGFKVMSKNGRELKSQGSIHYPTMLRMRFTEGKEVIEIAEHFGVTVQAVYKAIKRVSKDSIGALYSRGEDMIDRQLSVQSILVGLMSDSTSLLAELRTSLGEAPEDWDKLSVEKRKLILSAMAEIRAQLNLYSNLNTQLYSAEANQEFQALVIETIREASPEVAKEIIAKLQRRQPLRQFVGGVGRN